MGESSDIVSEIKFLLFIMMEITTCVIITGDIVVTVILSSGESILSYNLTYYKLIIKSSIRNVILVDTKAGSLAVELSRT